MEDFKTLIGIGIVTIVIVFGGIFLLSKGSASSNPSATSIPQKITSERLVRDDSPVNGTKDAPVTVVEFGDFQCPACGAAYPIVEKVLNEYPGKIRLVFRHFPLQQHQNALPASKAAEAGSVEGKFWMMYNLLYTNQAKWSVEGDPTNTFLSYADEIKMDREKFKTAMNDSKIMDKINRDKDDGNALGVTATPTFFVNGIKLQGVPSYEDFKSLIDSELAKSASSNLPTATSSGSPNPAK